MRLSQETIYQIIKAVDQGIPERQVAADFQVDSSTVKYHVERFEQNYGFTGAVYALIKPKKRPCEHPSLQCLICGTGIDELRRRERDEIALLKQKLDKAMATLERHGYSIE